MSSIVQSKIATSYQVVRHHVENDNKYNIYFVYTYSKILYGIEVYGSACNKHMNKIQVQPNRSLTFLFQKHYRTHTCDQNKDLNILEVPAIKMYRLQTLCINTNKVFYLQPLKITLYG